LTWTAVGDPILVSTEWQYTEPIESGVFFRLKHLSAPSGALFAIAQVEIDDNGLHILDSQVLEVERNVSDILKFPLAGCFENRRLAIKRLPKQPTLEQEVRRLFLPGYLQREQDSINIINRSEWQIAIEVSDFVKPEIAAVDLSPIQTKLDEIDSKINNLQPSSSGGTTQQPSTQTKELTYASNSDTNDVFYWIGTNYGTQSWTNPHTAQRVICSKSSNTADAQYNFLERLVDRQGNAVCTDNRVNSWMKVDLGIKNALRVNHYTIQGRQDAFDSHHPRSWKLQGSNDNQTWTDIDTQVNNTSINLGTWASIPVSGQTNSYRFLQILHTGKTAQNGDFLVFGEWEFYGTLTTTP